MTTPGSVAEALATMLSMTSGASMYALFVGIMATLLIQMDVGNANWLQKMETLNQYMVHRGLPPDLRQKIRESYQYRWQTRRVFDEKNILMELSPHLRYRRGRAPGVVCKGKM